MRKRFVKRMLKRSMNPRHLRDYALAVPYLLLGVQSDPLAGKWDCWEGLNEPDFLDVSFSGAEELHLSHAIRTRGVIAS
jgi:hypothetical protein